MKRPSSVPPLRAALAAASVALACAPRVTVPPRAAVIAQAADSAGTAVARSLAPVLYVTRDEPFRLDRVVAILYPTRNVIAYKLRWNHDVNGQWMPWTKASDLEELWVGYDPATLEATDVWTYWHGTIVHADWRNKGRPAAVVQWGKHGTLPYGVVERDLPKARSLKTFYAMEFALLPDILLGKLAHGGPAGFFKSYDRYRDFSRVVPLDARLDAVARTDDPRPVLLAAFGGRIADKTHWPDDAAAAHARPAVTTASATPAATAVSSTPRYSAADRARTRPSSAPQ